MHKIPHGGRVQSTLELSGGRARYSYLYIKKTTYIGNTNFRILICDLLCGLPFKVSTSKYIWANFNIENMELL